MTAHTLQSASILQSCEQLLSNTRLNLTELSVEEIGAVIAGIKVFVVYALLARQRTCGKVLEVTPPQIYAVREASTPAHL